MNAQEKIKNKLSADEMVIVGIGASAGGLEALEAMFDQMPNNCGMAFVIVQHLSPDFKSLMVELMGRHTKMAIHRVTNNILVEPDSLYLIPPKRDMIIKDGRLLLTERKTPPKTLSLPIDHFLKSLAAERGNKSVAVILSGTGSDGSRGIRDIHDAGGLVIVQSIDSAKFDGMPRSAIDSEYADVITTPEEIPKLLEEYSVHRDRVALRNEMIPLHESALERLFRAIQQRHRVDFSHYRPTTIGRRIERRIEMDNTIDSLEEYADLLEHDTIELDRLYADLLIGVTGFFRDIKPFESLKRNALQELLANHPVDEEFRVWIAACSTGEEAYSVAILIDECLRQTPREIQVKVFATDIHQTAVNTATVGNYTDEMLKGVSEQRLARYFSKTDNGYQINPDIRRLVVFAPHNLAKDPPFTRLSLITCRNLLIYLLPKAQQRVISHFHFALKKGGYLLLGSSETPGDLSNEFETVDANNRIYRKTQDAQLKSPLFSQSLIPPARSTGAYFSMRPATRNQAKPDNFALSREEIFSTVLPPGIVIDQSGKVKQVFRNAGKYLRFTDGLHTSKLLDMVDEDLKLALAGAIRRSAKSLKSVCYDRLQVKTSADEILPVKLSVTPLLKGDTPEKFVITFEQIQCETNSGAPSSDTLAIQTRRIDLDEVSKGQLEQLEQELRHSREILQATLEEMETSNEELQATNEELIASNEELQSSNEELHSVNEELFTVNGEYHRKISELTELTHDFDNLLESTEIHTLFLDSSLRIRRFTPRMADVLHLVDHDIGRRIDAFLHNLNCENLGQKVTSVLETSELLEEQISDTTGTEFLLRISPYRTGGENAGVVLTLIDISKLAAVQAEVTLERERFERAIQANRDGTWDWPDLKKQEMWWSPGCYLLLGYEPGSFPAINSEWLKLIHPEDREKIQRISVPVSKKCYVELHENFEYRMLHASGQYRWYCHRAIIDRDQEGNAIRMTGSIADIEDRKASESLDKEGIRMRDNFLSMLSHELRNPIGAIMNAVENINELERSNDSAEGADSGQVEMEVIRRQTRQTSRLLDDLLDVARFGRDKIEFRKEVIDVCDLVNTVIESVDYQLDQKQQLLKTSICEGPLNVIGDPSRLSQAQTNLIVNASKFSEPGQEIAFTIGRENDEVVISIVDQGVGIDQKSLASVFELFFQSSETLDRSTGGLGVGLSLAQKIVRAHNGSILAKSDGLGRGAEFQIRLPLTELKHEKRDLKDRQDFDRSSTCKVMLVEDNPDAREMLAKTLRRRHFEVLAVGDGKTAIKEFPNFEPQVAVVDIGLPGISGYDLAQAIRQNELWDHILLVALTGYGQGKEKKAILESGFNHHIVKPLQFDELHRLIANHLSKEHEQKT